jgi:hypothetical protein
VSEPSVAHFFVDEAGDLTLFDRRGRVIVGTPGVSHYFMVGLAELPNPELVAASLASLRSDLLRDPYFAGVPSMQPERNRTALAFHAKDDPPEVRREVFRLLPSFGAKVIVAIRRKAQLAEFAGFQWREYGIKLSADDVYDDLVRRAVQNKLHLVAESRIVFASRGKSARTVALQAAIHRAKELFERRWRKGLDRPVTVSVLRPAQAAGLQVIDYYLWALQRLFERSEDRFFHLLSGQYRLVMDLDDKRRKPYGEWYSEKNPLSLDKMKPVTSG